MMWTKGLPSVPGIYLAKTMNGPSTKCLVSTNGTVKNLEDRFGDLLTVTPEMMFFGPVPERKVR